ncbi:hypothetical protein JXR01_01375 [Candidatus Kaiserbacteria bacterium]|nr:MAG: hypothetical protein JXR01_01375 [Candidatus Kaiserbacteria bacterium]
MLFRALIVVCTSSLIPIFVEAASFQNPLVIKFITDMLRGLVLAVVYIGTPVLVVFIVWTGFLFVAAQGSADGITKAKKMALQVTIGGVLLLSLWAIVELVSDTLAGFSAATLLVVLLAFFLYVVSRR